MSSYPPPQPNSIPNPGVAQQYPPGTVFTSPVPASSPYTVMNGPVNAPAPAEYQTASNEPLPKQVRELRIYAHSTLVYWWPVWVIGFLMAGLSYWSGEQYQVGADQEWFHPSTNLGVIFFLTLMLVIVITNISVKGLASALVLMGAALVTLLLAYFGLWDSIFGFFGHLKIHLNSGAYLWFSSLLLIVWTISTFGIDRTSYWSFKPGQVTHEFIFGAGSSSYDTNGMLLEKHREDLFRHWLLGFGSGDLQIRTSGATRQQIEVSNVMFLGSKVARIQRLIAEEPDA